MKIKWSAIKSLHKIFPCAGEITITANDRRPRQHPRPRITSKGIKQVKTPACSVSIKWLAEHEPDAFKEITVMRLRGELL